MTKRNVIIMGAAGRDFHNFNTFFRHNEHYNVVAFTAAQIPDIDGRRYPSSLAGDLYPDGIPIHDEQDLPRLIKDMHVQDCVFSYSDLSYKSVMNKSALVNAAGANFLLLGPEETSIKSIKPVISVCAVRTGCGKSQTSRRVIELLMDMGLKVIAIRHPMPYGNIESQKVQRFAEIEDLKRHQCTIEEMEEYEPHIDRGNVIYAGVDYEAIIREAENDPKGCDVIVWDGGNNDFSFYKSDLLITVADPHRVGHEESYYPGEVNVRKADVVVINKVDSAKRSDVDELVANINRLNPKASVVEADSDLVVENAGLLKGQRVLVVEDGPTLTHGEMKYGAGVVAAERNMVKELVDPRPFLVGKLKDTFNQYPGIGTLLPAMGYGAQQLHDLEETINRTDCDVVLIGTPIDLSRIINIKKPHTRVYYNLKENGTSLLTDAIKKMLKEKGLL